MTAPSYCPELRVGNRARRHRRTVTIVLLGLITSGPSSEGLAQSMTRASKKYTIPVTLTADTHTRVLKAIVANRRVITARLNRDQLRRLTAEEQGSAILRAALEVPQIDVGVKTEIQAVLAVNSALAGARARISPAMRARSQRLLQSFRQASTSAAPGAMTLSAMRRSLEAVAHPDSSAPLAVGVAADLALTILNSGASTLYSAEFWRSIRPPKTTASPEGVASNASRADIEGAVEGAILGCIAGGMLGDALVIPGVGEAAGCAGLAIFGGTASAVSKSATSVIMDIWDWVTS
jgi:hypothetical protein